MSTAPEAGQVAANRIRRSLGVGGVLAVIAGILILSWPGKTVLVVAAIVACYAIAAGLVYFAIGLFSRRTRGWARLGHLGLSLVFLVVGVIALFNLTSPNGSPLQLLGILIGIMWIVEGIVSLSTIRDARSRGWSVTFAILSVIAGIVVLVAPIAATLALWWVLGVLLVVLGIMNIVRAFTLRTAF
jgi:uncharacterized membrane protein HdeD (DUF308 family)